jgi:hypothetical protein
MQYAERLPNSKSMLAPVVALAIGAAVATGTYALIDSESVQLQPPKVIVTETPAPTSEGLAAKNEAATAAAIGSGATSTGSEGVNAKDEAGTAAAIGSGGESDTTIQSDPHEGKSAPNGN